MSPHTDDAELGCGGTMARWIDEGAELFTAAFSTAETSLPPGSKPYRLKDECHAALDELGVPRENRFIYDFPVRELGYHRQEVLEEMVKLARGRSQPEVVLVPSGADLHQDHAVVHQESVRAFRHTARCWATSCPGTTSPSPPRPSWCSTRAHLRRKWAALTKYESQLEVARPYFRYEFIESMARVRGLQVKAAFAEAYEAIRIRL